MNSTKNKIRSVIQEYLPGKKEQTKYINKHFVSVMKKVEKANKLSYPKFKQAVDMVYKQAIEVESEDIDEEAIGDLLL